MGFLDSVTDIIPGPIDDVALGIFGSGSDSDSSRPAMPTQAEKWWKNKRQNWGDDQFAQEASGWQSLADWGRSTGNAYVTAQAEKRLSRLINQANRQTINRGGPRGPGAPPLSTNPFEGNENWKPIDWEGEDIDSSKTGFLRNFLNNIRSNKGGEPVSPAAWTEMMNLQEVEASKRKGNRYADEMKPMQDRINTVLMDLLNKPGLSAEELAAQRSGLIEANKQAELSRMKRVGAVLGQRGMDPASPASQYMASRTATEGDAMLMDSLRQHGLDAAQMAREGKVQAAGLSTEVNTKMRQLEAALRAGNLEALTSINSSIGDILQSIRLKKEEMAFQRDMFREETGQRTKEAYIGAGAEGLGALTKFIGV